jgi:hypothetical protein
LAYVPSSCSSAYHLHSSLVKRDDIVDAVPATVHNYNPIIPQIEQLLANGCSYRWRDRSSSMSNSTADHRDGIPERVRVAVERVSEANGDRQFELSVEQISFRSGIETLTIGANSRARDVHAAIDDRAGAVGGSSVIGDDADSRVGEPGVDFVG